MSGQKMETFELDEEYLVSANQTSVLLLKGHHRY